jgi:type IV secretion system protein VirB11
MPLDERTRRLTEKLTRELGPIVGAALADPDVIEVMLNPGGELWVERLGGGMGQVGTMTAGNAESLMATVASSLNTTITREHPVLEGELPTDGSRFEGLLPPVVAGPSFAIRKKASRLFSLAEYVKSGALTEAQRRQIVAAVRERENILVVGGTGTGKTTLVNAILHCVAEVSPEHRVVVIEDTVELQCATDNKVALRTSANVTMQHLLRATMRLRPDRIVVGEVRGAEALSLLKAWNTGHPGGVATVHANDAEAGLRRLEQLIEEGLHGGKADPQVIAEAVGLVIVIKKIATPPGRRVTEMLSVVGYDSGHYRFGDAAKKLGG